MKPHLFRAAGIAGLAAIAWVAAGYLRGSPVALAMTVLIGAFYLMGALELQRFAQATAGLQQALGRLASAPPDGPALAGWLDSVPAPLRHAVRLRVDGERAGLPGPVLAPYLAGLLVLLGMLGTFVGMVVTLQGTGVALESAVDVQSMRESLAAPVRGLGLAFGTSVAGVAGSAMLGLMSALCRRERQRAGQLLDTHTATTLLPLARVQRLQQQRTDEQAATRLLRQQRADEAERLRQQRHEEAERLQQQRHEEALRAQRLQHQEALHAQQQLADALRGADAQRDAAAQRLQQRFDDSLALQRQQAGQLPLLLDRAQALLTQLGQQSRQQAEQLLASQQHFLSEARQAHGALAAAVEQTLQRSLADGARIAATTVGAAVQDTMQGIARETAALQAQVAAALRQQLHDFAQRFEAQSSAWVDAVGAQVQAQSAPLLQALEQAHASQQAQQAERDGQQRSAWSGALAALTQELEHSTRRVTERVEAQSSSTLAEVARLVQSATAAPREAALVMAEVVTQLRDGLSQSLVRDNGVLEERSRIMATLHTLLGAVQQQSTEHKAAIDQMLAGTAHWLQQAGAQHLRQVDAEAARLHGVSAQLTSSAVEVASLGEAFGTAVDLFSQGNAQLVAHLQRLEEALARNSTRSDEQLAYYVAQAREVIDLSLLSQKQIVDDLQRLAARPPAAALSAAGAA